MANYRKLLLEMEKVFKKVDEGVDEFQETLNKMNDANSENQREKFQDELKREMKKLQRLRDSIKGWQQSPEIKDKEKLNLYRRIIEERMEQFKDIEKESKMKPHSKQGLQAAEKIDPNEKERSETIEFLQGAIARLNDQMDLLEKELEELEDGGASGGGGAGRGRKNARLAAQVTAINARLVRHKHHIHNLELIMRLLNNESLETEQVKDIIEDVDDYIQRNGEDNFVENELIYDDLQLDELGKELGSVTAIGTLEVEVVEPKLEQTPPNTATSPSPTPALAPASRPEPEDNRRGRRRRKPRTPNSSHGLSAHSEEGGNGKPVGGSGGRGDVRRHDGTQSGRHSAPSLSPTSKSVPSTPASKPSIETRSRPSLKIGATPQLLPNSFQHHKTAWTGGVSPQTGGPPSPPQLSKPQINVAELNSSHSSPIQPISHEIGLTDLSENEPTHLLDRTDIAAALARGTVPPLKAMAEQAVPRRSVLSDELGLDPYLTLTGTPVDESKAQTPTPSPPRIQLQPKAVTRPTKSAPGGKAPEVEPRASESGTGSGWQETQEAFILPAQGASPLAPLEALQGAKSRSPEQQERLNMLQAASAHLPLPMDSEHLRPFFPRTPVHQVPYYPSEPPAKADTVEYFERLQPETLFFIFYYMEGTKSQYLAAKALKALSWRYHKKYLVWFQRLEDPSLITEEYEQGTYIYFDYEKWAQRKKESFTFEYQYLEDQELP